MAKAVDKIRAENSAREAFDWLKLRGVPPTPQNFELIYNYFENQNFELCRAVEALPVDSSLDESSAMSALYERFIRDPQDGAVIADIGDQIHRQLDTVLHMMESAGRDQAIYGHTLTAVSGQLGGGTIGTQAAKGLIDQIIVATRGMEARTKLLESQLQASSREVIELRDRLDSVSREALTDGLTGIPNRKAFDAGLQAAAEDAAELGGPLCLMMVDIDHFKKFNDTWGHQTGDQVLRLVGNCLSENVKGRDTAARYGGEEFAVILPQTHLKDAVNLADRIRAKVEAKQLVKKSSREVLGVITFSAGVAVYRPGEPLEEFVSRADACLYDAKGQGRNRVVGEANDFDAAVHKFKKSA